MLASRGTRKAGAALTCALAARREAPPTGGTHRPSRAGRCDPAPGRTGRYALHLSPCPGVEGVARARWGPAGASCLLEGGIVRHRHLGTAGRRAFQGGELDVVDGQTPAELGAHPLADIPAVNLRCWRHPLCGVLVGLAAI